MTQISAPASPATDPTGRGWRWEPQPGARALVDALLATFLERCPGAAPLARALLHQTGTPLAEWVAVVLVQDTPQTRQRLAASGFTPRQTEFADADIHYAFEHRLGSFPDVLLTENPRMSVGIAVESVADFFAAMQIPGIESVQGEPGSRARWARAIAGGSAALWVCERHGYDGFGLTDDLAEDRVAAMHHLERFRSRPRRFLDGADGLADLHRMLDAAIEELGQSWASDVFLTAEREYWARRNAAARAQRDRQDAFGLGFANHDRHVYRCSRAHFAGTAGAFEKLGFTPRERVHAGGEAGWGVQVFEHPVTRAVVGVEVDLSPAESAAEPSREGLAAPGEVGTVGLWCALHGESLFDAGMHRLACRADHAAASALAGQSQPAAAPAGDGPRRERSYAEGERWVVAEERLQRCLAKGWITAEQAEAYRSIGAIGSRLDHVERRDGFKGSCGTC